MLVLTRKVGQTIRVGDAVITILGKHRVGIEAPKEMKILRGEVDERKRMDENNNRGDTQV